MLLKIKSTKPGKDISEVIGLIRKYYDTTDNIQKSTIISKINDKVLKMDDAYMERQTRS